MPAIRTPHQLKINAARSVTRCQESLNKARLFVIKVPMNFAIRIILNHYGVYYVTVYLFHELMPPQKDYDFPEEST